MKKLITLILVAMLTLSMNAQKEMKSHYPGDIQVFLSDDANSKIFFGEIELLPPAKSGGMPLMDALNNRKTNRDFTQDELTPQQLSDVLWAAVGVNREDGRRTSPTASNSQQIEIYVLHKEGAYLYDPQKHILKLIASGDHRKIGASQERFQDCPIMLIIVANYDKMAKYSDESKLLYGSTDSGNVSQNIYLYCASEGLATCALGSIHRDKLQELLKFNGKAVLGQSVGVAK